MAGDSGDTASPTSPSLSNSTLHRHFYLAVDRIQFKMDTLVDLLDVVGRRASLPVVVCCSSRDELDALCSTVSSLPYISLASLYSDLAEAERSEIMDDFRQVAVKWYQNTPVESEKKVDTQDEDQKSHMIVVTDACLPIHAMGEVPLSARVLINYELPAKKEIYLRRTSTCLATDGIIINMVVGGEVVKLKSIEESMNLIIAEMPIQVSEIL